MEIIASRIREERRNLDITQEELAKRMKIGKSTISNWESGYAKPTPEMLIELSKIFNVSVDYLLGNSENNVKSNTSGTITKDEFKNAVIDMFTKELNNITMDYNEVIKKQNNQLNTLIKEVNDIKKRHNLADSCQVEVNNIEVLGKISAGLPIEAQENVIGYTLITYPDTHNYFALQVDGDSMNNIMKDGSIVIVRKQECLENGEIGVIMVNGYDAVIKRFKQEGDIVMLIPESNNKEYMPQIYNIKETEIRILGKVVEFTTRL